MIGHPWRARMIIPSAAAVALALAAMLFNVDEPLYRSLLTLAFANPFRTPFIDLETIGGDAECWRRGIDVYRENPCDVLGRVHNYSPLWLRMDFWPADRAWTPWLGMSVASAFIAAFACIPTPGRPRDLIVIALATFSSLTVFAVERGNADLMMFVLAVASCWCAAAPRLSVRLIGYGLILAAGLLKFYPLVMLVLILRERLAWTLAIGAAAAAILAGFVGEYASELAAMARNIPTGPYFTDMFGARQLPGGLWIVVDELERLAGLPGIAEAGTKLLIGLGCALLLAGLVTINATRRAARPDFQRRFAALPAVEAVFLTAGAALVAGCFVAGQNVGYRGVIFLLVLPGFLRLAGSASGAGRDPRGRAISWAIVFVMWGLTIVQILRFLLSDLPNGVFLGAFFAHWLVHELAWWWIVGECLAVLLAFVMTSPAMRPLATWLPSLARAR